MAGAGVDAVGAGHGVGNVLAREVPQHLGRPEVARRDVAAVLGGAVAGGAARVDDGEVVERRVHRRAAVRRLAHRLDEAAPRPLVEDELLHLAQPVGAQVADDAKVQRVRAEVLREEEPEAVQLAHLVVAAGTEAGADDGREVRLVADGAEVAADDAAARRAHQARHDQVADVVHVAAAVKDHVAAGVAVLAGGLARLVRDDAVVEDPVRPLSAEE